MKSTPVKSIRRLNRPVRQPAGDAIAEVGHELLPGTKRWMNYRRYNHRDVLVPCGLDDRMIAMYKAEYVHDIEFGEILMYRIDQAGFDANGLKGSQSALDLNLQATAALEQHRV